MDIALTSVKISINSCHCGIVISRLQLPDKCFIIGIIRNNQVISANTETLIFCEDYVLATALNPALIPALKLVLNKKHPIHYSHPECLIKNTKITY
ncbi:hypothetical protein IQ259_20050 [Fortiea sp. LEGE XX443]|uniref:hypothetical protein n=1 Tax=Fortiea sp. LEGE XX443 TaxID=1828611 RepID=UPI001882529D|nr:hypothetical protein [Fortiea sp. LEGE XX443]MBE9007297.1 hypothetical protein [Fortiea sp. LEGE XX443]